MLCPIVLKLPLKSVANYTFKCKTYYYYHCNISITTFWSLHSISNDAFRGILLRHSNIVKAVNYLHTNETSSFQIKKSQSPSGQTADLLYPPQILH